MSSIEVKGQPLRLATPLLRRQQIKAGQASIEWAK
jgi:hypothetical protein